MIRRPPRSTLFPYTTLFRSERKYFRLRGYTAPNEICNLNLKHIRFGKELWARPTSQDRKSTRLNSSHGYISYAVFCLKKKKVKTVGAPSIFVFVSLRTYDRN